MFFFTKISIIIFSILLLDLIAEIIGIISPTQSNYIFIIGASVQLAALIYLITMLFIRNRELNRGIKIIRYKIEDKFIKGDTEILPEFMTPTNTRKSSIFKIFVEIRDFKEHPDFGIIKIGKGKTVPSDIKKHLLRVRTGAIKDSFVFDADIVVKPDEKINFKFKDDTNVKIFFVGELYVP